MRKKQATIAGLLLFVLLINLGIITSELEDILGLGALTTKESSLNRLMTPIFEDKSQTSHITLLNSNDRTSNHLFDSSKRSVITPSVSKWADDRFKYRKNITVPFNQITKDLTNFPVLIDLCDPDLKNVFQPSGNDILFTDALGTQLDHEIELFNQTYNATHGQLVAWVRGNLSSTKDTIFSMYYGNPSIATQENPEGVWKNDFTAVWHLSETSGPRYDSTFNNVDGSPQNYENNEASLGKIAGADALDGTDDYIETYKYPDEIGLGGKSARTVSAWVYTNNFDGGGVFEFGQHAAKGLFSLQTHSSDNQWIGNWWGDKDTFKFPSLNAWVYLTVVYDGTTVYIYANSELQINSSKNLNTGNKITVKIGSSSGNILADLNDDDSSKTNCLNGLIDEMRISPIARSTAWIQTEFSNQFDPNRFYSISTEQTDNNPPSITDFGVNSDQEGQLTFFATAIDDFTSVENVTIEINGSLYSMAKNESEVWVYQYSPVNFGDYFIFRITNASDSFGNYLNASSNAMYFRFTVDFSPPQVLQAYFTLNDRLNPTNLTFYAEIKESGSGIEDIVLFYHFEEVIEGDEIAGSGSILLQETESQWVQKKMSMLNESKDISIYSTTVPFVQNKTTWKVLYRVKTVDKYGNIDENAFIVNSEQVEEDIIIYSPKSVMIPIDFSFIMSIVFFYLVLLILGITVVSSIYVRYFRKPELLDKKLLLKHIDEIDNMKLRLSLPNHTHGIVVSFFDEEKGPVPYIVTPRSLRNDPNVLLSLSFRAFSNCEFVVDPNRINQAIFNFTTAQDALIKVLSYSFALKRPSARGGTENVVLSVLILPDVFPIVNQFSDMFFNRIKKIHKLLDQKPEEKKQIFFKIIELREYISQIILSYKNIYGNSEYFPQ
ncbi:MAG: DUF2341 domain-containing protein [Candidatus Hodarchaeota archaeon]